MLKGNLVEKSIFNRTLCFYFFVKILILIITFTAQNTLANNRSLKNKDKIAITADNLITDKMAKMAEFSGNVTAIQGTTVINSDNLKVFYKKDSQNKLKSQGQNESLHKIVAEGNVKIRFDNGFASTQHGVYSTETMEFILTGENSKFSSGNSFIVGDKITYNRKTDNFTVQRKGNNRIEAVIFSGEQERIF